MEYRAAVLFSVALGATLIATAYAQDRDAQLRDREISAQVAKMPLDRLYSSYWSCDRLYRITEGYSLTNTYCAEVVRHMEARADEIRLQAITIVPQFVDTPRPALNYELMDRWHRDKRLQHIQEKILDGRGPPASGLPGPDQIIDL